MLEAQIRAFGVPVNPCVARRSEAPVDTKTKSTPSMSSMRTSTPTIAAARGAVAAKKPHSMESQLPTHKAVPEGPITSHMFRNIPRKYTADDIASELQVVSPTSTFDFISLPWDTNKPANLGFAFVNFLDAAGAAMARAAMHGQLWKKARQGAKAIKVCTAHVQGLRENVLYCADHISPMLSVEHHPLVLFGGRRIDFGDAVRLFGGQSSPCPLELQPSQSQQQEQQQQQHQQQLQQPPQMQLQRHPSVPAIAVSTPPMSTRGLLWQYQPGASSSPLSARGLAAAVTAGGRATPMRSAPVVPVTTGRRQAAPQQRPAWVGGPTVRGGGVSGSGHQSPVRPDMPRLPFQGGTVSPRHRSVSPVPNQGYPNGARSRTAR